jgi:hypothetical protein
MSEERPWLVLRKRQYWGRFATLKAAQSCVDRPFLPGFVSITHSRTGERWERRDRIWHREIEPAKKETAA